MVADELQSSVIGICERVVMQRDTVDMAFHTGPVP